MKLSFNTEDEYEDLLGQWANLEAGLGVLLSHPDRILEFGSRVEQYDAWMQDLLRRDTDVGLYLLFQLSTHSPAGYSTSHALVCGVLCHLLAADYQLQPLERDSLVRAALTMNIAMTALQDELASQTSGLSLQQRLAIRSHAARSAVMLSNLGVANRLWLQVVQLHHQQETPLSGPASVTTAHRLGQMLQVVDRYAAMISPRQSREGRSAAESAQSIIHGQPGQDQSVGQALVRIVGLCPPGTLVQLDTSDVAVVTRRSKQPNRPEVAAVLNVRGQLIKPPALLHTATGQPIITAALAASAVQERLNHHIILKLSAQAT